MPSAFAHAFSGLCVAQAIRPHTGLGRISILAAMYAILPDLDSIGFHLGIPYASPWGHRGFTHSLVTAVLAAILGVFLFFRNSQFSTRDRARFGLVLFLAMASHGILDTLTNGGLGVALFWPFSEARTFCPWRPIAVSPLSISAFFSPRGWAILKTEAIWVGIPSLAILVLGRLGSKGHKNVPDSETSSK